ncbi:MAG TPA: WG repeat-containing protein [Vicinamibacterales bacterium]|jgi:hypothetical protein
MVRAMLAAAAAIALGASAPAPARYLVNEDGVYGFVDAAGGRVLTLPAAVTEARPFAGGLAAVARREASGVRWGFIDEHGAMAILPRFDAAGDFSDDRAAVVLHGRLGYIDRRGALVIAPQFAADADRIADAAFSNGLAAVTDVRSKRGYIDRAGRAVIAFQYAVAFPFAGDRARVARPEPDGEARFGYIDRAGRWVVPPRFQQARDFAGGVASVLDGSRAAFIDRDGRTTVTLEAHDLAPCAGSTEDGLPGSFSEGLAAVRVGCLWGYIDSTGATVIPPAYFSAGRFSGGVAAVNTGDAALAKWGYVDRSGRMAIAARFSTAAAFDGPLALVQIGGSDQELLNRALLRGLEDDAANQTIKTQAKADFHPGTPMRKPELAYVDATGRVVWHHAR